MSFTVFDCSCLVKLLLLLAWTVSFPPAHRHSSDSHFAPPAQREKMKESWVSTVHLYLIHHLMCLEFPLPFSLWLWGVILEVAGIVSALWPLQEYIDLLVSALGMIDLVHCFYVPLLACGSLCTMGELISFDLQCQWVDWLLEVHEGILYSTWLHNGLYLSFAGKDDFQACGAWPNTSLIWIAHPHVPFKSEVSKYFIIPAITYLDERTTMSNSMNTWV